MHNMLHMSYCAFHISEKLCSHVRFYHAVCWAFLRPTSHHRFHILLAPASCVVPLIMSRLPTMCCLLLPAGYQWGTPPDRGAEPCHLDAPGVYPWHGGQHWCQLCRHLQGQRPVPVSVFAFACGYCLCHLTQLLLLLLNPCA